MSVRDFAASLPPFSDDPVRRLAHTLAALESAPDDRHAVDDATGFWGGATGYRWRIADGRYGWFAELTGEGHTVLLSVAGPHALIAVNAGRTPEAMDEAWPQPATFYTPAS